MKNGNLKTQSEEIIIIFISDMILFVCENSRQCSDSTKFELTNVRALASVTGTVYTDELQQMCKSLQGTGLKQ